VQYPHYYPRLHHANVELRTAYLDQSVEYFAAANRQTRPTQAIMTQGAV
jgi:hypothetical protein